MPATDALAQQILSAYTTGATMDSLLSAQEGFDLEAAYAVQAEFTRLRTAAGRTLAGLKVGFANRAMWRALKLQTLIWGPMFDDTVQITTNGQATFNLSPWRAPKIEPEIVFKLSHPLHGDDLDAAAVFAATEWIALGFEIVDCPFPGWQFKPADFVAAFGLHAGLVVGPPIQIDPAELPNLKIELLKNGTVIEEGTAANSLKNPALCIAELARSTPLAAGELISTGSLTPAQPIAQGETWQMRAGAHPSLTLTL